MTPMKFIDDYSFMLDTPLYCVFISKNDYDAKNDVCHLYKHRVFDKFSEAVKYAKKLCKELVADGWEMPPYINYQNFIIFEKDGKQCHVDINYR